MTAAVRAGGSARRGWLRLNVLSSGGASRPPHSPVAPVGVVLSRSLHASHPFQEQKKHESELPPELNQDLNLSREAMVFIEEGDKHLKKGEIAVAIQKYEKVIQTHRYHPTAYAKRGDALAKQGNYHEAIDDYKRVLMMVPGNVPSLCSIATCRIALNELDDAMTILDQCIYLDPSFTRASLERGRLKVRLNKLEEAIQDFERVREKDAGNLDAAISLAAVHLHLGRVPEARKVYEDILRKDVHNFRALAGLNIIAFGEERHDDAVAYAEAALQSPQVPGDLERSDLLVKKASSILGMSRIDEAYECVQKAVELWPENHVARFVRYQILMHRGRYQEAADDASFFLEASQKRFDMNTATPEAIATFRNTRSRVLVDRGKCLLRVFLHAHPEVRAPESPKKPGGVKAKGTLSATPGAVSKDFVEDLLHRVKVSKDTTLMQVLEDFLFARSENKQAKDVVDPLLYALKATVNEYLRHQ